MVCLMCDLTLDRLSRGSMVSSSLSAGSYTFICTLAPAAQHFILLLCLRRFCLLLNTCVRASRPGIWTQQQRPEYQAAADKHPPLLLQCRTALHFTHGTLFWRACSDVWADATPKASLQMPHQGQVHGLQSDALQTVSCDFSAGANAHICTLASAM